MKCLAWMTLAMVVIIAACVDAIYRDTQEIKKKLDCIALPDGPVVPVKPKQEK